MVASFSEWLAFAPLWVIALVIFGGLIGSALMAGSLRRRQNRQQARSEVTAEAEGSITISSILGLLALLLAFTFSIALDRFDTRR